MANDTAVELSKGGTDARVIFAKDIKIKDLWHIAMGIKKGNCKEWSQEDRDSISEDIVEVWSLTHHLKDHIIDRE